MFSLMSNLQTYYDVISSLVSRNVFKSNQQKYLNRYIFQWDRFINQYINIIGYRYSIDICIQFFFQWKAVHGLTILLIVAM